MINKLICWLFGHDTGQIYAYAWARRKRMRVFCMRCRKLVWIRRK